MAFPKSVSISWDANPASDNVVSYTVSVNGAPIGATASTSMPFTVPAPGTYTAAVHATNTFGDGPDGTAALVAALPGTTLNVTFVVPA